MPITSTIQQGTLSLAAVTPGNSAIGDAAAAGTSASVARADHKHGREASGTPGSSAVGDSASAGTATTIARSDHVHGREAFGTPVTVNGQTTSLSAGSLTTVARADHVHTTSNVPVLLASANISNGTTSVTFGSIPQTFMHLKVMTLCKTNATGGPIESVRLQFNGDTGSNYYYSTTNASFIEVGYSTTASTFVGSYCAAEFQIANYCNALGSYKKSIQGTLSADMSTSSVNIGPGWVSAVWNSTAAITSMVFSTSLGSWLLGSSIRIYGIPG